ncbi:hypothetical protein TSOC_009288 [Tetrabaena socialis]|uniref:Uncharacterized protein n=1 Tax=Tetrabaena socialis TaxID=47790 RepID=A0A2J7ZWC5_9CHLO|nr:hypothetical protein TSOC_009288 [Tetrabaena socialis]|eukprot:PNH04556.1 hypothetical protein TSOC_009288 [Tetrabaena socialis]
MYSEAEAASNTGLTIVGYVTASRGDDSAMRLPGCWRSATPNCHALDRLFAQHIRAAPPTAMIPSSDTTAVLADTAELSIMPEKLGQGSAADTGDDRVVPPADVQDALGSPSEAAVAADQHSEDSGRQDDAFMAVPPADVQDAVGSPSELVAPADEQSEDPGRQDDVFMAAPPADVQGAVGSPSEPVAAADQHSEDAGWQDNAADPLLDANDTADQPPDITEPASADGDSDAPSAGAPAEQPSPSAGALQDESQDISAAADAVPPCDDLAESSAPGELAVAAPAPVETLEVAASHSTPPVAASRPTLRRGRILGWTIGQLAVGCVLACVSGALLGLAAERFDLPGLLQRPAAAGVATLSEPAPPALDCSTITPMRILRLKTPVRAGLDAAERHTDDVAPIELAALDDEAETGDGSFVWVDGRLTYRG